MERDARYLSAISSARIHHEFARIAAETEPERALVQLDARGILPRIHRALRFSEEQERAMKQARSHKAPVSSFWPILAFSISPGHADTISSRLGLTRHQRAAVEGMPRLIQRISILLEGNSTLVDALDSFPLPTVWAVATLIPPAADRLLEYLTTLRHLKPALRGDHVIALGVPRGPQVGEVLRRLRVAKLDGEVKTRRDEERLVRSLLAGALAG
jgi:tRNA nucleotidyltransferase (CCA-adding enzyme)